MNRAAEVKVTWHRVDARSGVWRVQCVIPCHCGVPLHVPVRTVPGVIPPVAEAHLAARVRTMRPAHQAWRNTNTNTNSTSERGAAA